ncbi:MAG TPA: ATP-binding protein [Mycobacteriales bacterium]|nr:ATP-binding protein [Mycobacteriales bacterium]
MEIKLSLALPRDELSIPVVRHVLGQSMRTLGVRPTCMQDIQLAISEACTNVLDHAPAGSEYEVSAGIDDTMCVIEICDRGGGFQAEAVGQAQAAPDAEQGRGIHLMRALVDQLAFTTRSAGGTVVRLEKLLEWEDDAPGKQLFDCASESPRASESPAR